MEDSSVVQKNIELQRQWYGEPLGDRVRRLVVAFDVSQAFLAEVIGISPPMLSQVMSGRRAKIGNPAVLARLIMVERKILTPGVAAGDPKAMEEALIDVRDSNPTVNMNSIPVHAGVDDPTLLAAIKEFAEDENLVAAADLLDQEFPAIADLLRRAGKSTHAV